MELLFRSLNTIGNDLVIFQPWSQKNVWLPVCLPIGPIVAMRGSDIQRGACEKDFCAGCSKESVGQASTVNRS